MIYLRAIGGLGNQMFQIAFARYLSVKYDKEIFIDVSSYDSYKIRSFSLDNLYISEKYIKANKLPISFRRRLFIRGTQILYRFLHRFLRMIRSNIRVEKVTYNILVKKGFYYNFNGTYFNCVKETSDEKFVYGYFQNEKYFKEVEKLIKRELRVKTEPTKEEEKLLKKIKSFPSIGVSMRLGDDYINSPGLNVCDDDFYLRGIEYLLDKFPNSNIFIFSDEIERAKKIINSQYSVTYVEGFNDYQSLRLLYSCKNFVIANSSFSWWGAYLSDNHDKKIVVPSKWTNIPYHHSDIFTKHMIRLDLNDS